MFYIKDGNLYVFSSTLSKYLYCPMSIFLEKEYGPVKTEEKTAGAERHKQIEAKEEEGTVPSDAKNLKQALEISLKTDDIIQSVDKYVMKHAVLPGVYLLGKPDFIAAHRGHLIVSERKPYKNNGELYEGELLQLISYAMLAQAETGLDYNRIHCYADFYDRETSELIKRNKISIDTKYIFSIRKVLTEIRDICLKKLTPRVTQNPKKCWKCAVRQFCDYAR